MKYNVSSVQRYIWLDQQLSPDSPKYNIGGYALIRGQIDLGIFKQAVAKLFDHHRIFSFFFCEDAGTPVYYDGFDQSSVDELHYFIEQSECAAIQRIKEDFVIPFDVNEKRLAKVWLIRVSSDTFVWYTKLHHLIADGYTFHLLFNEVSSIYSALVKGESDNGSRSAHFYETYIADEQEYEQSGSFNDDKAFWLEKYQEHATLIFNKQHTEHAHFDRELVLSEDQNQALQKFTLDEGVSVLHTLLASFSLLLSKFHFKKEINIGTPILNRRNRAEKITFGPFIHVLPLKLEMDQEQLFLNFIGSIKKEFIANYRHQRFQQADILRALPYQAEKLYDVRISLENFEYQQSRFFEYHTSIVALANNDEEEPLSIHIFGVDNGGLKIRFDINGAYISEFEAAQFIESLDYVLRHINELKTQELGNISITSKCQLEETKAISRGLMSDRGISTFLASWRNICHVHGEAEALVFGGKYLTYTEVNAASDKLGAYLKQQGIKKGHRVGMMLPRSEKCIIAILGILKVGAVYVPIDKELPLERRDYMISDSQLKFLIVDNTSAGHPLALNMDQIPDLLFGITNTFDDQNIDPDDGAYIIYTSGSTGMPKGVLIRHHSLLDYVATFSSYFNLNTSDCIIQQSSFSFDTSIEEIFPILSVGGTLVLAKTPGDFHEILKECELSKVTILSTNPFLIQYLNDNYSKYHLQLRTVISGGDTLKKDHITNLIGKCMVYNTYGPTESTVCATYHYVDTLLLPVPIGKPIDNRSVYIMDGTNLLPKGAVGEIVLSGKGIAQEYINQAELTAQSFVFINGERAYKTGDLGKWNSRDMLLFLGRKDHQLSYRGYRIEPGDIEVAIKSISTDILSCTVKVTDLNESPSLIGYVVSKALEKDGVALLESLKLKLPSYMVPAHIVYLEEIPLLLNGKINYRVLPLPKIDAGRIKVTLASTKEEFEVSKIWEDLLNLTDIDVHTSFFLLGGHSLLANKYVSIIRENTAREITLKEFYESPTIYVQSKLLLESKHLNALHIKTAPLQELYPLSFSQERIWFLHQLDEDNKAYYVPRAIKMVGVLDIRLLENTFSLLIKKHEILRTVFPTINGEPFQKILSPYDFKIPVISYEGMGEEEQDQEVEAFILAEGNLLFDLENGPLLRGTILKKSDKEHIVILCEHHLIHDGWTQGVLLREFIKTYVELSKDPDYKLIDSKIQFKDFACWQKEYFKGELLNQHLDFWKVKLENHLPVLPIPMKKARPKEISGNGALLVHTLDESFSDELRSLSFENDVTLFITMLTAFKLVLSKFSNEADICVGTGVANRRISSLNDMLGMVINTLTLRSVFCQSNTLLEVLQKVKETCFEAYAYEDTPFGKVVEHIEQKRTLELMPLFQYMFSFMNTPSRSLLLPDLELEILESHNRSAKFDINVVVVTPLEQEGEHGDKRIIVEWEYNSDIFSAELMQQMLSSYIRILSGMVADLSTSISKINYLSKEEEYQLIYGFNDTEVDFPVNKAAIHLFEEQVKLRPFHTAVIFEDKVHSYQELNVLANQLGDYLKTNYKICPDDLICIRLGRSDQLILAIMGVLKSGGAYVPIDPAFPEERIGYIVNDTQCKVVITEIELAAFYKNISEYSTDDLNLDYKPENLAYVMYTSGTTGKPKGVMLENKGIVKLVKPCSFFPLNEKSILLTTGAISFDATIFEYFGTLLNGSTLIFSTQDDLLDLNRFKENILKNKVNSLLMTSSWFSEIVDNEINVFQHISRLIVGGDILSPMHVKKLLNKFKNIEIVNGYGPTENTTFSLFYKIEKSDYLTIPVGKPIPNSFAYILNDHLQVVPIGVMGKIFVSGDGVARGYLNMPDITREKFMPNPFKEGVMMYDTGDLGKWMQDGNIEFYGRKDQQVKIRGHRIELDEIENTMSQYSEVMKQVIVACKIINGEKILVAYYVAEKEISKVDLKNFLKRKLPDYMVPNHYMEMEKIPLTNHGKVNRETLPDVAHSNLIHKVQRDPGNDIEKKLVMIWKELLGVEKVGVTDNFFELGGHSLKITQLINKIKTILFSSIKVRDIFLTPTIEDLAKKINECHETFIPRAVDAAAYPLTFSQKRIWILSQFEGGNRAYNIPGVFELSGQLAVKELEKSLNILIERHESLRTCFKEDPTNDEVCQYIIPFPAISFSLELSECDDQEETFFVKEFYNEEFDLKSAPLLKAKLVTLNLGRHLLLFAIHHIIGDGWSMEVFTKELMYLYNGLVSAKDPVLTALSIQYKDYAVWSQSADEQDRLTAQEAYWLEMFSGELPVLELPAFNLRPRIKTYNGATVLHSFNPKFSQSLQDFSEKQSATLYMTIMAGINGLLYRYTGGRDIIIGTAVAGRIHSELENQIGLYLNTLAIRTKFNEAKTFTDLLAIQKQTLIESYENQEYPFDRLVEKLSLRREPSRSALFDFMVILQNQQNLQINNESGLEGIEIRPYDRFSRPVSQFDMTFSFSVTEHGLQLRLEYNTDIYEEQIVLGLVTHLENYLNSVISIPEQTLDTVKYLSKEEEEELLHEFNAVGTSLRNERTIIDLLEAQFVRTPDEPALVFGEKELTYRELELRSNQLANYLLNVVSIKPDDLIGIELERTEWMVITMIAVMKTGAAYVPLDPKYPQERIAFIEKDSKLIFKVDAAFLEAFERGTHSPVSPKVKILASHLAYIIYTSGSTGMPKGVMIEHGSVVSMLKWAKKEFENTRFDVVYFTTSYCFDISVYEIYYPLSIGKKIRILNNGLELKDWNTKDKNILLNTVPSVVQFLIEQKTDFSNVSALNIAGETLPIHFSSVPALKNMEVRNLYGPSEDTTYSTCYRLVKELEKIVPIGKPILDTQVYILSDELQLQAKGATGELCISGSGLARGYLNSDQLTKEKFVAHPFIKGERLYRTGDMGRWLPDGNLEFIGRNDHQIKLRGHRIELGEIENAILRHKKIKQVIVDLATIGTEKMLVAYLVLRSELDLEVLRSFIQKSLPEYMIPAQFIEINHIPVNDNGKLDRKSIKDLEIPLLRKAYVPPGTEIERIIASIWTEVLGVEKISTADSFFELGGSSINAIKVLHKINEKFNISLQLSHLFNSATIADLSGVITVFYSDDGTENDAVKSIENETYRI